MGFLKEHNDQYIKEPLFNEGLSSILQYLLIIVTYRSLYIPIYQPIILLFVLLTHIWILKSTRFSEYQPFPFIHHLRNPQGVLLIAVPLSILGYFITFFIEGILNGFNDLVILRSNLCMQYFLLMMIWVLFAGLSFFGLYFAFSSFFFWSPLVLSHWPGFDPPFIIYPGVFVISLMGIGCWYSYCHIYLGSIFKKHNFDGKENLFKKYGLILAVITNSISILLIIFEKNIAELIITIV